MTSNQAIECWIGINLPFRPCDGTYQQFEGHLLPPINTTKYDTIRSLQDLLKNEAMLHFKSVTACYIDVDLKTGQFYRDQQDCVIWKFIEGHVVAYDGSDQKIGIVANSLAEFFARVELENRIWFQVPGDLRWSHEPVTLSKLRTYVDDDGYEYLTFYAK